MKTVTRAFLRELLRHRVLAALQIFGVACGVAAAVGMSLSARTALASFELAVAFLQGEATHSIQRPAGPLEETLLPALARDPAVRALAPVLDRRLRLGTGELVRLLGVDPFLDAAMRPGLFDRAAGGEGARGRFFALLGGPPTVLMERGLADSLGLVSGATLETARGRLLLAGLFASPTGEPLAVMDIGQAQRLLGAAGVVDRVDLILDDEAGFRRRWGAGFLVQSGRERAQTMAAMIGAFRVNLQSLSLLALLVGVFLVYNTAMFAVVSRRHDAGVLRSLGAGRGEIAAAFCVEDPAARGGRRGARRGARVPALPPAHRNRRRHDQHPLFLSPSRHRRPGRGGSPPRVLLSVASPGCSVPWCRSSPSRGPSPCNCSGAAPRCGKSTAAHGRRRSRGAHWPR